MANELTNITLIPDTDNKYTLNEILGAMRDMADFSSTCIANRDRRADHAVLALIAAKRSFFPHTLKNPSLQTTQETLLTFEMHRNELAGAPEISGQLDVLEWVIQNGQKIRDSLDQMPPEEIDFCHRYIGEAALGGSPGFVRPDRRGSCHDTTQKKLG